MQKNRANHKPIIIISSFVIFIISLFAFNVLKSNDKPANIQTASEPDEYQKYAAMLQSFSDHMEKGYRKNGLRFQDTLEDIDGSRPDIKKVMAAGDKIVLQYSELTCNICVDTALAYFMDFSKQIGEENTMLLVRYKSSGFLNQFIRLNHVHMHHLYKVITEDKEDTDDEPYLFIMDHDFHQKDVFYPMKEIPEFTHRYYKAMFDKYFKQEKKVTPEKKGF